MGIRRYIANKDNTITNAYKSNLTNRATGSNMGESDVLEVFSIYGQATTSSSELARMLVQFPVDTVSSDRTSGAIPASGSVSFYLRMYNAKHSNTVPRQITIQALPLSRSWSEGVGLDMEDFSDHDVSNWVKADDTKIKGVVSGTFKSNTKGDYTGSYVSIYDGNDERYNFWFKINSSDSAPSLPGTEVEVDISTGSARAGYAKTFQGAVHGQSSFTAATEGHAVIVTNVTGGAARNPSTTEAASTFTIVTTTSGANATSWDHPGSDFLTSSTQGAVYTVTSWATAGTASALLDRGTEDLDIDVTPIVEKWITGRSSGGFNNYGFVLKLSASHEDDTNSYYTKKFFSRGSEFFFKRPMLEARWDSTTTSKDDRGNFFGSSSLAPQSDNVNVVSLYNNIRGQLKDIPNLGTVGGTAKLKVGIYGSTGSSGTPLTIVDPTSGKTSTAVTGSRVATGIYTASLAVNTTASTVYDIWYTGSTTFRTGTISVSDFAVSNNNPSPSYFCKINNLKDSYHPHEEPKLRLYNRPKNWNPNLYTVASSDIETTTIDNVYYKIIRISDGLEVISYGTGSDNQTKLSYDVSGNYFDLDMSLFESDYMYGVKFAYYINGQYHEQPEFFKFRVEDEP